jgi:hypothetical protein
MNKPAVFWFLYFSSTTYCFQAKAESTAVGCLGSGQIISCEDWSGSRYHISVVDKNIVIHGYETISKRSWTQIQARYGSISFTIGYASDGEVWSGFNRSIGWTSLSRIASSASGRKRVLCSKVTGCSAAQ